MCYGTNLNTWNMSYPYNFVTNYGGRYQFNLIDSTQYTPQEAYAMRNVGNPFYQVNSLIQNIAASNCPNPASNYAAAAGASLGAQAAIDTVNELDNKFDFERTVGEVTGLKSELDSILASPELTTEQKDQVRAIRRKVEALIDKLEDIALLKQRGATYEQIKTAINQVREQFRIVRDEASSTCDRIVAQLTAEAEAAAAAAEAAATEAGTTEEGTAEEGAEEEDAEEELIEGWGTVDVNTLNLVAANIEGGGVSDIADEIYSRVDGAGSGNVETFIKENITKDNVVEVLLHWNQHYAEGYAEADPLGLTETIFDEYMCGGYKHVKPIITALQSKLAELEGIDNALYGTAKTQLNIAAAECNPAWYQKVDEDKVSAAINKAHEAMVYLMLAKAQKDKDAASVA